MKEKAKLETLLVAPLLSTAFCLRMIFVHYHPSSRSLYSDMENYVGIADMIGRDVWLPGHFFQPVGFPYLLSLFKAAFSDWIFWFDAFQALLSTSTLFFMYRAAYVVFGRNIALSALAVGTFHLSWIGLTGFVMAETVYTFLLSVLAWLTVRLVRDPTGAGSWLWAVVFTMALWFKGTHLFVVFLFLPAVLLMKIERAWRSVVIPVGLVLIGHLMFHGTLAKSKVGVFQVGPSAGGLNFVEGKCPDKENIDKVGRTWTSPLYAQLGGNTSKTWDREFMESSYFFREGLKCVRERPSTLLTSLESIPFLFFGNVLWPVNQLSGAVYFRLFELFFALFLTPGLTAFFLFCLSRGGKARTETLAWVLPVIGLFLCVYVFKSEIRFRIPFDVWIVPMALFGWKIIIDAVKSGSKP